MWVKNSRRVPIYRKMEGGESGDAGRGDVGVKVQRMQVDEVDVVVIDGVEEELLVDSGAPAAGLVVEVAGRDWASDEFALNFRTLNSKDERTVAGLDENSVEGG